jgi:glycosyltransferase involved in cell wall biosynthesis
LDTRPRNLLAQRWLWTQVDQVLSVSSRTAERMAALTGFPSARIRTIRNGVDLQRFRPRDRIEARTALDLPATPLTVGMAGRLVPVKDHHTFLSALALLREQSVDVAAAIVGDGPLKAELRARAADLGLGPHVRFIDARTDIERVLPAFDVFVSSSVSEGLSNSILEAMATGLPVVATHVGGTDELVDDGRTGVLVPPSDPHALARALRQMISNTELRLGMGASARRRAEREFDLERMIREYERVYLALSQASRPLRVATA